MTRTALYDLFLDGERVYVGVTRTPARRIKAHIAKGLVPETAEIRIVRWFDSRQEALAAERIRITEKRPKLNLCYIVRPNGEEWNAARKRREMQRFMPSPAYVEAWAKAVALADEIAGRGSNQLWKEG